MSPSTETEKGIYADLLDLIKLEHKASGFSFLPRQPVHSLLVGRHASRLRGRGLNFEEIRRYLPGDDVRTIDWKVTRRTGKTHVRVFTEERDRPALLVVDQRISMFFGTQVAMKSVTAAELAALAAWRVFSVGDRTGALVFNDTEVEEVRPHRSRRRVMQILGAVVKQNHALKVDAEHTANPDMLNHVLDKAVRLAKHDYLVTIISDFYGADEETRRLLTKMAQHNDVLAALVHDPSHTKLPSVGRLVVSDGDLQFEMDTKKGTLRKKVTEYGDEWLRSIKEELARIGIPVLLIHTAEDVAVQIRRLLGHAPMGQRR